MVLAQLVTKDNKRLLLIGLSAMNLANLMADRPISLSESTHQGMYADFDIGIIYGETEEDIAQMLQDHGCFNANTKIINKKESVDTSKSPT